MRYPFTLNRMATKKRKRTITSVGDDVGKLEPSYTAGGNVKWCSALEDNLAGPQKVKYRVII